MLIICLTISVKMRYVYGIALKKYSCEYYRRKLNNIINDQIKK